MDKPKAHDDIEWEGGKHTPGPWLIDERAGSLAVVMARTDPEFNEYVTICSALPQNARLIAAAPDLLEALRMITDQLARGRTRQRKDGEFIDMARAAIAKATGETT
jgi:hypothetical protein